MENFSKGRTMQLQLHNGTLIFEALGKRFKVVHVAKSVEETNAALAVIPDVGIIDTDKMLSLYFIAENNSIKETTQNKLKLTKEKILQEATEVWKNCNSWNLTYRDFIELSFKTPDSDGAVYISPDGVKMSALVANEWCENWKGFYSGWIAAYKHLNLITEDRI
jgi:hypothetical protein